MSISNKIVSVKLDIEKMSQNRFKNVMSSYFKSKLYLEMQNLTQTTILHKYKYVTFETSSNYISHI